MVIIEIILIFIIYLSVLIGGFYYVDLIMTRDQFTRSDLKNITPYLKKLWDLIQDRYAITVFATIFAGSAIIGIAIPLLSYHWFLNSAILFAIIYIVLPVIKNYFEQSRVTATENALDTSANIFIRYADVIIFGFGAGTATSCIYNWGASKEINFFWFLINFIVITVLLGLVLKNALKEE